MVRGNLVWWVSFFVIDVFRCVVYGGGVNTTKDKFLGVATMVM